MMPAGQDPQLKAIDAPIEVLIFDRLTRPIARHVAAATGPLVVTGVAFSSRLAGAACVLVHSYVAAAGLLLFGFYLDAVDGKVARIRGDQIGIHGTTDFLLDQVALVTVLIAFILADDTGRSFDTAVLVFMGVYLVYTAIGGTRLRILGDLAIDWKTPGSLRQAYAKFALDEPREGVFNKLIGGYVRLQGKARSRRLLLRPTGIEAQFALLVVTPLLGMSTWGVVSAIILLAPDFAAMSIATIRLARVEDAIRAQGLDAKPGHSAAR